MRKRKKFISEIKEDSKGSDTQRLPSDQINGTEGRNAVMNVWRCTPTETQREGAIRDECTPEKETPHTDVGETQKSVETEGKKPTSEIKINCAK